jgi:cyclase
VRTVEDVRRLLNAGADKTSFQFRGHRHPDVITGRLGQVRAPSASWWQSMPSGAAPRKRRPAAPGWDVYSHGGRRKHRAGRRPVGGGNGAARRGEILLTSMDRDGTKSGFDLELTRRGQATPFRRSGDRFRRRRQPRSPRRGIQQGGANAVLAASIFHYGEYTVGQAKARMAERGIP